jgi:hypothetical protein
LAADSKYAASAFLASPEEQRLGHELQTCRCWTAASIINKRDIDKDIVQLRYYLIFKISTNS